MHALSVPWIFAIPSGSNSVLAVFTGPFNNCVFGANKSVVYSIEGGFRVSTEFGLSLEGTVGGFQIDESGENVPDRGKKRIHKCVEL